MTIPLEFLKLFLMWLLAVGIPLSGHAQEKHQQELMAAQAIMTEIETFLNLPSESKCESVEVAFCLAPSWQARLGCKLRNKDFVAVLIVALDQWACPACIVTGFVGKPEYFYGAIERDQCSLWDFSYIYWILRQNFPTALP